MHFVIRLFPEITVKSISVRKHFTKILAFNLVSLFRQAKLGVEVQNRRHSLNIKLHPHATLSPEQQKEAALQILTNTPGIAKILQVQEFIFKDLEEVFPHVKAAYEKELDGKTFCVRVKRIGSHTFTSQDAEIFLGAALARETNAGRVNLKYPQVKIELEIRHNKLHLIDASYTGLGGFPVGSQGQVLSLVSGGFDSTVASYLCQKRGLKTHFCFFNLGGLAHEIGVKQSAYFLWRKFAASHKVKFISVPFEEVVREILTQVDSAQMGVVLKRMMLRAATQVAKKHKIPALVTGEAIAQVASQTLTNLAVIDEVTDHLVLRPLATSDKPDIINLARQIGAFDLAAAMPEYCGVISQNPSVVGDSQVVAEAEASFDFKVLDAAVTAAKVENLAQSLASTAEAFTQVEIVSTPSATDLIVDIRHPDQTEAKPLLLTNNKVVELPFYQLNDDLAQLADVQAAQRVLLYCDQGMMSKIHAHQLGQTSQLNLGVFSP